MNFRLAFSVLFLSNLVITLSPIGVTEVGANYTLSTMAHDEFFVAKTALVPDSKFTLSRLMVARTSTGAYTATLNGLVPEKCVVNNSAALNPLYNQRIAGLSSYQAVPLVSFGSVNDVHSIALIQDTVNGSSIIVNSQAFGDALGNVTKNILTFTAGSVGLFSHGFVFAAVSPSDAATFIGQEGAGIAAAQILPNGIVPRDITGGNSGPCAAPLRTAMMQIGGNGAISGVSCMCWNQTLNKLFVGLTTLNGGVAVMVGSFDIPSVARHAGDLIGSVRLSLSPIISPECWDGQSEDNDYFVASESNGIAIQSLEVMNASTGKDYLIVGRLNDAFTPVYKSVYAAPLVSASSSAQNGFLAKKNDDAHGATHSDTTQLFVATDTPALVGGGDAPAVITSMKVMGDSVFISCAGGNDQTNGIFFSQALFNINGSIRAWSPWRVAYAGQTPVHGFGRDTKGRLKFLSGDHDTVNSLVWGSCYANGAWGGPVDETATGLVSAINTFFPITSGGVQSVSTIHAAAGARWGNTSSLIDTGNTVMAFTGRNSCALALSSVGGDVSYSTAVTHFKSYDLADNGLALGMVTTAAISRGGDGWVFVGGTDGVAVLSQNDGSGWSTLLDNALGTFDALDGTYTFKALKKADGTDFTHVRQIFTDENYLYILSNDGLYRVLYDENAFKTNPNALGEVLIASPAQLLGAATETILSACIEGDYIFLATTSGLWMNNTTLDVIANDTTAAGWKEIMFTPGGTESFGVCAQLSFIPSSAAATGGTLVVLTSDVALNVASVYRIDIPTIVFDQDHLAATLGAVIHTTPLVSSNTKAPVATARFYTTLLGQLREHFYTDGGMMIDAASAHHTFTLEGSGMIRVLPVSPQIGAIDGWNESIQPALDSAIAMNTITGITSDHATGTVIISGAWGIQILQ